MGLLDEAIQEAARNARSLRLDRVLAALNDEPAMHEPDEGSDDPRPKFDRVLDMLQGDTFRPKPLAGIIRAVCDAYEVDHLGLNPDDIGAWRNAERLNGSS